MRCYATQIHRAIIGLSGRIAPIHLRYPLVCAFGELLCHHQYLRHHSLSEIASVPSREAAETGTLAACAAQIICCYLGSKIRSGVLRCYPADAVQADYPFPFSNGWMTVVAASDFQ